VSATNKVAYVFPGQGSQKVGMGKDIFDTFDSARAVFHEADKVLGIPLTRLCFEGPEEELRQTINAQPALVTMSYACYKAAISSIGNSNILPPAFLAGHSLGEYTALILAGVLDFPTTLQLARERGRLMYEAGQKVPGGMAAIMGMEESGVNAVCQETGTWLANINCPGQLVISGPKDNIQQSITLALSKGAAKAIALQVSGAFHSPLMKSAADGLAAQIEIIHFSNPLIPVIANTSALPLRDSGTIKQELVKQVCTSVQWQKSVEYMIKNEVSTFIEIGAGKVLAGLIKRIDKNVKVLNIGESAELGNIAVLN
jgi:[acyl-carrier-protein] S-malonyltransferase